MGPVLCHRIVASVLRTILPPLLLAAFVVSVPGVVRAQTTVQEIIRNVAQAQVPLGGSVVQVRSGAATTPVTVRAQLVVSPGTTRVVPPGGTVVHPHTIRNLGNFADSVRVDVQHDASWSLVVRAPDDPLVAVPGGYRLGPIAPGDSARVEFEVGPPPAAALGDADTLQVRVTSGRVPAETHAVTDVARVAAARIDPLTLRAEPTGVVRPGALLAYRLRFGNPDPSEPLRNVVIEDTLEAAIATVIFPARAVVADLNQPGREIPVQASWDPVTRRLAWSCDPVPPGFEGELAVDVRVAGTAPEGATLVRRFTGRAAGAPDATSNTVTHVVLPPILQLTLQAFPPEVEAGDPVFLLVTATNTSQLRTLASVQVDLAVPAGFRVLDDGSTRNGAPWKAAAPTGGAAPLVAATLDPGATATWTIACAAGDHLDAGLRIARAGASAQYDPTVRVAAASEAPVRILRAVDVDGLVLGRVYVDANADGAPGPDEGLAGARLVLEDGRAVRTDERGRYHLDGVRPGVHVLRLDVRDLPVELAFESAPGRHPSRFVDVRAGEVRSVDFRATWQGPAPPNAAHIIARGIAPAPPESGPAEDAAPPPPPVPLEERIRTLAPQVDILEPGDKATTDRERIKVTVQRPSHLRGRLTVNGRAVPDSIIGRRVQSPARNVTVRRYVGVALDVGENHLVYTACDGAGRCRERRITVFRAGPPRALQLAVRPTPADGRTSPVVRVTLLDAMGRPAAHERFVTLEAEGGIQGRDADLRREGFQVRLRQGYARVTLQPTEHPGERRVRARFEDLVDEKIVRMEPAPRDWLVVGRGEVSVSAQPQAAPRTPDTLAPGAAVRSGVFARGRVGDHGELTLRWDGERRDAVLFDERDPDVLMPAVADAALVPGGTPSRWRLFARYDVPEGYAQLGDFRTRWTGVELARFDRTLTGFDGTWVAPSGDARVHAFVASTRQTAWQDEFAGTGTSGPFTLSQRPVLLDSDKLFVEVRDRIHSERVLHRRELRRNVDYTLQWENGSVLLREPLPSADADFNPIVLVAQYETLDAGREQPILGLHGTTVLGAVRAGWTAVHEETGTGGRDLLGSQASWRVRDDLDVEVEYAQRRGAVTDDAVRVELHGRAGSADRTRVYYREIGAGFRNPSRPGESERGTRKYGVATRVDLGPRRVVGFEGFVDEDLQRGRERFGLRTDYEHPVGDWQVGAGHRWTGDRGGGAGADDRTAQVLAARAAGPLGPRVRVEASAQKAWGTASAWEPTRVGVGAAVQVARPLALRVRHEWDPGALGRAATLVGIESHVDERTAITGRVERAHAATTGERTAAWVGLRTGVDLGRGWSLTLQGERGQVLASTPSRSTALSVGAAQRGPHHRTTLQLESRWTSTLRDQAVRASVARDLGADGRLVGRADLQRLTLGGRTRHRHDAVAGIAYRPLATDRFQVLASVGSRALPLDALAPETATTLPASFARTLVTLEGRARMLGSAELVGGVRLRMARATLPGTAALARTWIRHARWIQPLRRGWSLALGLRHRSRTTGAGEWSWGLETAVDIGHDLQAVAGWNAMGFADPDAPRDLHTARSGYVTLRYKFDETLFGLLPPRRPSLSGTSDLSASQRR